MNLQALDCSPLPVQPTPDEAAWLRDLAGRFEAGRHVVALGDRRQDDEPVVYCERDGTWWAGRYIGVIAQEGGRLTIEPRFGLATLAAWLGHAVDAVLVRSPGRLREDVPFVVQLLAMVWGRAFADAARHGLPALRLDRRHVGAVVRGRLDVRGTLGELLAGREAAVSIRREKSLENPAGRILAAAYRVLRRRMGPGTERGWVPERVAELLPPLLAAVGTNPAPPTDAELARVRYTPITLGFARATHISRLILRHRGLLSEADAAGESEGVLFDVAELWELFVLAALRRAGTGIEVLHGTSQDEAREALLTSEVGGNRLGELRPDAVVRRHRRAAGVVDAKYKSPWPTSWNRNGPQREDLYQMAAYLSRYSDAGWGVLAYPADPDRADMPPVEARNPWRLQSGQRIWFLTLPHDIEGAAAKLRPLLSPDAAPPHL
jgi:5-methylcytosine-specific restriction enzyme subunit McrC